MKKNDKYWESSHSSNSKKNLKRKVVSCIKKMNKNLRDDPLWKGRFVVHCDNIFRINTAVRQGTENRGHGVCPIFQIAKLT